MSARAPLPASYLDYNASAPVKPAVIEAMAGALGTAGNPSSVHRAGRAARRALEQAREAVAALAGATPEAVVFTSGGTEANNQALGSIRGACLVSAVEHDSVLAAAPDAERLPVDALGRVDFERLADRLAALRPALLSVMLANNETGVVQPVAELALEDRDWRSRVGALRDRLEAGILAVAPAAQVYGRGAERLANTSCLSMPGVSNQTQLIAFDLAGIAVSTGSACSSGKVGPSHVLAAMGVDPVEAATAIRVSLGWASTARDVERFVAAWTRLHARTRRPAQSAPARSA